VRATWFSYLTHQQYHTSVAVSVNRQYLHRTHRKEINNTYTTKTQKKTLRKLQRKTRNCFWGVHLMEWRSQNRNRSSKTMKKDKAKQNKGEWFYMSQHIRLNRNRTVKRFYTQQKIGFRIKSRIWLVFIILLNNNKLVRSRSQKIACFKCVTFFKTSVKRALNDVSDEPKHVERTLLCGIKLLCLTASFVSISIFSFISLSIQPI